MYEMIPHDRESDDVGSINLEGRVGNRISIIFSHLEALTRTLGKSLPEVIANPEILFSQLVRDI